MQTQKNVLIVDDFGPNLLVLESILENMPINIFKASNGHDALKIMLNNHVDMVLLDVQMPEISGYEVAKLIRKRKKNERTPIIFLSGLIDEEYDEFKEQFPENIDCFQKPFDVDRMRTCVNHFLNES